MDDVTYLREFTWLKISARQLTSGRVLDTDHLIGIIEGKAKSMAIIIRATGNNIATIDGRDGIRYVHQITTNTLRASLLAEEGIIEISLAEEHGSQECGFKDDTNIPLWGSIMKLPDGSANNDWISTNLSHLSIYTENASRVRDININDVLTKNDALEFANAYRRSVNAIINYAHAQNECYLQNH